MAKCKCKKCWKWCDFLNKCSVFIEKQMETKHMDFFQLLKFTIIGSSSHALCLLGAYNRQSASYSGFLIAHDTEKWIWVLLLIHYTTQWQYTWLQRYRPEIPEPEPSLSWHGAPIGGIRVFRVIKITMIRQVRMYCGLSMKINMCETLQRSWTHFVCVCFCVCSRQKLKYSQLELHGWQRHCTGCIGILGSPFYICAWLTATTIISFNLNAPWNVEL